MAPTKDNRIICASNMWCFDQSAMVVIHVGKAPNQKDFCAHQSILTAHSEFFRRALNGPWKESQMRAITLSDESAEAFGIYLHGIYTNQFAVRAGNLESIRTAGRNHYIAEIYREYQLLFEIYVLADFLQDLKAKNSLMEAIFEVANTNDAGGHWTAPGTATINFIYNKTLMGSPARRVLVDLWAYIPEETMKKCGDKLPGAFLLDSLLEQRAVGKGNPTKKNGASAYFVPAT